jgi:heme/copper-type cytochrome/quinol oxidase subunit 2
VKYEGSQSSHSNVEPMMMMMMMMMMMTMMMMTMMMMMMIFRVEEQAKHETSMKQTGSRNSILKMEAVRSFNIFAFARL